MSKRLGTIIRFVGTALGALAASSGPIRAAEIVPAIDFDRDIRPVLSENCYACHGPDAKRRKADLRLDIRDGAFAKTGDKTTIVPGNSAKSELVRRISATDDDQMPPVKSGKKLSVAQIETLRKWVDSGAQWEKHWAFVPPVRPAAPAVKNAGWVRNPIDAFVLVKLEEKGLAPSPEADRYTLIRRLSLDLTGLPPSVEEVDAFVNDVSPDAYEKLVDRLLASKHYGEKMALAWLDLARFGDTNGYHHDSTRQMWLWRNYVIDSFNNNKPFDQFTIEQLAGDLMPDATVEQKIASGFNRNTRFNEEGGADPNEFVVQYAMDRANTLGTVWLGMTVGCAQCHTHKYDPITIQEYYKLYAFFNSIEEPMVSMNHDKPLPPLLSVPTPEQEKQIAEAKAKQNDLEKRMTEEVAKIDYQDPGPESGAVAEAKSAEDFVWFDDDFPKGAVPAANGGDGGWVWVPEPVFSGKRSMKRSGPGLHQHYFTSSPQQLHVGPGDKLFAYVYLDPQHMPKSIMLQYNIGGADWYHRAYWGEDAIEYGKGAGDAAHHHAGDLPESGKWVRLEIDPGALNLPPGTVIQGMAFTAFDGVSYWDKAGIFTATPQVQDQRHLVSQSVWEGRLRSGADPKTPAGIREIAKLDADKRDEQKTKALRDYYLRNVYSGAESVLAPLKKQIDEVSQNLKNLEDSAPTTMVSVEMPQRRKAFVLLRGNFETPAEEVTPDVPAALPSLGDRPHNRLGLAQWVVDRKQPLTARVAVNRFWRQMFGTGIVKTLGDLGSQGERPSHPELLDWLAVEFMDSGWDVKHTMKLIVTSAAYRQAPKVIAQADQLDHDDRLLWRSPRYRLTAEEVRDNALAIAGSLSRKIGGPSVMPYQSKDFYNGKFEEWKWQQSTGEDLYRRGMYTFWRRTSLYPTFVMFDAPSREVCIADRSRTNTPLQALAVLNDPAFVESARVFAQRIMEHGGPSIRDKLIYAFRTAVARPPTEAELDVLKQTFADELNRYAKDAAGAKALVSSGNYPRPSGLDVTELAAWTTIGNVILSLDETVTRE
jgi:mono/diheme cytochrome c family protein